MARNTRPVKPSRQGKPKKAGDKPDPAQGMIDFTRRLLNVSKSEVDAIRKEREAGKKRNR